jgi:putative flippase GtrA
MTALVRQSLRFGAVGLFNTAIGLSAIYVVMFVFQAGPVLANAIGYAIGWSVSFSLNRSWTFNSALPPSHVLPKYILVTIVGYMLNLGMVVAATSLYSANPYLAQIFGVAIYTVCVFFGCRWFVFAPRRRIRGE